MINLAIIGYGGMGGWHHQNLRDKLGDVFHVSGAYDIRPEASEQAKKRGLYVYESLRALLDDRDVDIVVIATPNNSHKELCLAALGAGKHVLCEKPAAMNAAEFTEMMAAAEQSGRLLTVHQNRRWDKDFRIVRETLRRGTIGRPYLLESNVQGANGALHSWRAFPQNGGGMLLDWGVHLLDQILLLADSPVVSVSASLRSVRTPEVDDNIKVFLRFANDCAALVDVSTNCFISLPRWHVQGAEGTLRIEDWELHGRIVKSRPDSGTEWQETIVYGAAGPTRTMAPRPVHTLIEEELPQMEAAENVFYRNLAAALCGREELAVKPDGVLRVLRLIDLIFTAEQEKRGIECHL